MKKDFYVYGLFAENVCFYIGKGRDDRKIEHFRNYKNHKKAVNPLLYNKLKSLENSKIVPIVKILQDNLTNDEALEHEKRFISLYKRKIDGGTLCNVLMGGNQPPTHAELLQFKGKEKMFEIRKKQVKTTAETIYNKNKHKIEQFKYLITQDIMLKDIAKKLGICTDTLRRWSKKYNIKINYNGKTKKIKEHLNNLKQKTKNKIQKTSKLYVIKTPSGDVVMVQKLVSFCKEHDLDYANLRRTFNGNAKHHKHYTIIRQQDPTD